MQIFLTCFLLHFLQGGLTAAAAAAAEADNAIDKHPQTTPDSRIIGGDNALKGRYPYTASIHEVATLRHRCVGTLIAPDIVLTAAVCTLPPEQIAVRIGPHNLKMPIEGSGIFPVLERVVHPEQVINPNFAASFLANIADFSLLKLDGISNNLPMQLNTDAAIPIDGQPLRTMGWGFRGFTNQGMILQHDILQVLDSAVYINNAECERILINTTSFSEDQTLTDDTMCTLEPERTGPCETEDSGVPLIVPGATPDEDVQVGIASWNFRCAGATVSTMFARVSWGYDFIRANVCRMSVDPPSSFECTDNERIQPTSIPTASPAPTGEQVEILLQIFTGVNPYEIGWRLEDSNGRVWYEKGPFSYTQQNSAVLEILSVTTEESYVLVLTDFVGSGAYIFMAVQVFLGNTVDPNQLLASSAFRGGYEQSVPIRVSADGLRSDAPISRLLPRSAPPTASPTASIAPTGSNLIDVVVFIKFDSRPVETSWILKRADGRLMAQGGPYSPFIGSNIAQLVSVEANQMYIFTIYDFAQVNSVSVPSENGICCEYGFGEAYVYLGSQVPSIKTDNVLAYDDGRFGREKSHTFVASPDAIIDLTVAPTMSPTLTLSPTSMPTFPKPSVPVSIVIWFDDSPGDVGWILEGGEGAIMDVIPGTYTNELSSKMVQTIVQLEVDQGYQMRFFDSAGDGYCCGNGVGNITVYIGPDPLESNILTANTGGLTDFEVSQFVVPEYLGEAVPSPVTSSELSVPMSVVIWFDDYPSEVGWTLSRDGAIIMGVPFDTYKRVLRSQTVQTIVEVTGGETYEVQFSDKQGDGYCCEYGVGNITVYLGTELLENNVLAADSSGSFTIESEQFDVPSLVTIVMPTTAPTAMSSSVPTVMPTAMLSSEPTIAPSAAAAEPSTDPPSSSASVSARLLLLMFPTLIVSLLIHCGFC